MLVVFPLGMLGDEAPTLLASLLSWVAILGNFVAAWFGGELVDRLGVGVSSNASLDAPSSLTTPTIPTQSASQTR
jgi:predicted MFS family arabinose efflux permease